MSTTTQPKLTLEQYLTYDDGTDSRYELVRGLLLRMNPPALLHIRPTLCFDNLFNFGFQHHESRQRTQRCKVIN